MTKSNEELTQEMGDFLATAHAALVVMGMGYRPTEGDSTPYESLAKITLYQFLLMCESNNVTLRVCFKDKEKIPKVL
jgi:hypothetical protein